MSTLSASVTAAASAAAAFATTLSISQQIAEFAAGLTPEAIPAAVRENAKLHVLDVCGTALAATSKLRMCKGIF